MTTRDRLIVRAATLCLAILASGAVLAAGGEARPKPKANDADAGAVTRYNAGIELRDAAWRLDERLAAADGDEATRIESEIDATFRRAVTEFEAAVAAKPDFHQAWSSLGYARRRLGEYGSALEAYDRALAIEPDYAEAIEYRGQAYLNLGRLEDAKQAYTRLSRLAPAQAGVLLDAMETWLAGARGGDAPPEGLDEFESWVAARVAAESSRVRQGW